MALDICIGNHHIGCISCFAGDRPSVKSCPVFNGQVVAVVKVIVV